MTALFERLAARVGAAVPLAVPGLQLVPKGAIALAEHVNRYYRVFTGADPQNVAVRLPTGGGSFEVRHSATNAALLRVTDAGLDFPAGGIGTVELADGSVTSAKILDNEIVNADINAAAAVALTKLGHVGAGNVLKSNGTANVGGQVVNADIAPAGTAQIAVNKLLHVGAGNVIRSDGAQNVAGQVVTGDIADGTILNVDINAAANINGSKLLDNSVTSAKLAGGIAVGAGTITTTEIADGTILNVDINAAANIAGSKLLDASVTTAKLAAGAATTIPTQVTVPGSSTISTTANNMTGAAVSMTTQGGPVLILLHLYNMNNTGAATPCNVQLWETTGGLIATLILGDLLNIYNQDRMGYCLYTPPAGARTFYISWYTGSGTANHGGGFLSAIEFKR